MNLRPTKVGAEPKKVAILVGLLLIAGYFYFSSRDSSTVSATPGTIASPVPVVPRAANRATGRAKAADAESRNRPGDFRPVVPKNVDPSSVDPTLRLEELARLRRVEIEGGGSRSLFEISAAPPALVAVKEPGPIKPKPPLVGPMQPPPPPGPPPDPKAPPIPLKFYGFVNQSKATSDKRAFFLDGEEIVIATEGDMIKKRYKIIRIGVNSATVEDTNFKSNNQQTLPLEAEMNG